VHHVNRVQGSVWSEAGVIPTHAVASLDELLELPIDERWSQAIGELRDDLVRLGGATSLASELNQPVGGSAFVDEIVHIPAYRGQALLGALASGSAPPVGEQAVMMALESSLQRPALDNAKASIQAYAGYIQALGTGDDVGPAVAECAIAAAVDLSGPLRDQIPLRPTA
jgi:hypothetical protein